MEHECKDSGIKEFYDDLFLDNLGYEEYLTQMGVEYWTVGEAFPFGDWATNMGVWVNDRLMNPDEIKVRENLMLGTKRYFFQIDKDDETHPLVILCKNEDPPGEFLELQAQAPDLVDAIKTGEPLEITPGLMGHLKHGGDAWSPRGYPLLMRAFKHLLLEERLNRAQLAISERLYNPLILLLLGHPNLGEDGEPWIPTQGDINRTQMMFENLMESEYRTLVHFFGLDIQIPFSGERMPQLGADYDRVEMAILGVFGMNKSLIYGGSGGQSYASTAISAEFLMQRLKTYQSGIQRWIYQERYKQVAMAQKFYDYDMKGKKRIEKEERYLIVHPDGSKETKTRKKLLFPKIRFRTMDFRDERAQREFMQMLKSSGVLISNKRLAQGVDYEPEREREQVVQEEVEVALTKAEIKRKLIEEARERGLLPFLDEQTMASTSDNVATPMMGGGAGGKSKTNGGSGGGRTPPSSSNGGGGPQRPAQSDEARADMPKAAYRMTSTGAVIDRDGTEVIPAPEEDDEDAIIDGNARELDYSDVEYVETSATGAIASRFGSEPIEVEESTPEEYGHENSDNIPVTQDSRWA